VNLAKLQVAGGIDADEQKVGILRMKGNEVSNVSFESSNLFTTGIERMDQANLVSRFDAVGITRAQTQR
jgi:hypothetical protein